MTEQPKPQTPPTPVQQLAAQIRVAGGSEQFRLETAETMRGGRRSVRKKP